MNTMQAKFIAEVLNPLQEIDQLCLIPRVDGEQSDINSKSKSLAINLHHFIFDFSKTSQIELNFNNLQYSKSLIIDASNTFKHIKRNGKKREVHLDQNALLYEISDSTPEKFRFLRREISYRTSLQETGDFLSELIKISYSIANQIGLTAKNEITAPTNNNKDFEQNAECVFDEGSIYAGSTRVKFFHNQSGILTPKYPKEVLFIVR